MKSNEELNKTLSEIKQLIAGMEENYDRMKEAYDTYVALLKYQHSAEDIIKAAKMKIALDEAKETLKLFSIYK